MKLNKFILIIPAICFIFFWEMILYNKIPLANDSIAHAPIKKWTESIKDSSDIFPQWFPNLFSGMPSYGAYINTSGDPTGLHSQKFFLENKGLRMWFWLSIGGMGLFWFLTYRNFSITSSLFGGIAYSLSPHMFGLISAGHNNKIMAIAFIPWIFFSVFYLFQSLSLKSILLLSILSSMQLWMNHPQIVYYTWMFIFLWWAFDFFLAYVKSKSLKKIKPLLFLFFSIFLTLLMVSDPYIDVFTFQKHSNRGAPSVLDNTKETSSGTKWDYATQWSFHPNELISFFLPYHYGLQNFKIDNRTNPSEFMKQASYWGYMPFTQSTHYMGLLVILLPMIGFVLRFRNKSYDFFESYIWLVSFIILLIGFGKHLPFIFQLLFNYAPFFSKFRIPSMIYVILIFNFSYLAAASIDLLISSGKNDLLKASKLILIPFILIVLLFLIFGESLFSFSSLGDNRFPDYLQFVQKIRVDYFEKGAMLALAISLSFFVIIWMYSNDKLRRYFFSSGILVILLVDFWILNNEFLSLTKKRNFENQFVKSPLIDFLVKDDSDFRIFPADNLGSNMFGYWGIQSIGGYRAVKLRNYQDLMDVGGFKRPTILNMLNVKYLLTKKTVKNPAFTKVSGLEGIYHNLDYLPRAWFVSKIDNVKDQKTSLNKLMDISFRPKERAVLVEYDGPTLDEDGGGYIESIDLKTNQVKINCFSERGSLLVLSEVYYKPGWKCKIDGNDTKIYQTNHVLRSVYVPKGEHEVVFYYDNSNWQVARMTSRASFFLATFLCSFLFYNERRAILRIKK